jgi:hypothetical protein
LFKKAGTERGRGVQNLPYAYLPTFSKKSFPPIMELFLAEGCTFLVLMI